MKYKVRITSKFNKDLKVIQKRGYDLSRLRFVIQELANGNTLSPIFKDHQLKGNYKDKRECHIYPDWLLIYKFNDDELLLELLRTGTHSDLF